MTAFWNDFFLQCCIAKLGIVCFGYTILCKQEQWSKAILMKCSWGIHWLTNDIITCFLLNSTLPSVWEALKILQPNVCRSLIGLPNVFHISMYQWYQILLPPKNTRSSTICQNNLNLTNKIILCHIVKFTHLLYLLMIPYQWNSSWGNMNPQTYSSKGNFWYFVCNVWISRTLGSKFLIISIISFPFVSFPHTTCSAQLRISRLRPNTSK